MVFPFVIKFNVLREIFYQLYNINYLIINKR